jgi:subtilase family serine protease
LVWSVSYGGAEAAVCLIQQCQDGYEAYLQRANTELQKLALLGVSVLVASGDSGSPGTGFTCPINAQQPMFYHPINSAVTPITCPDFPQVRAVYSTNNA